MSLDLVSPTARDVNLDLLHPTVRQAVKNVLGELKAEKIPLFVFEAFRTPVRQNFLYAKGRPNDPPIVTYAKAWQSYHQYGLAVDLVFGGPGHWTWSEPKKGMWKRMHEIGESHGLMPLNFETPHLQISGTSSNALAHGIYPDGGDEVWAETLASAIGAWMSSPAAPPPPKIAEKAPVSQ